MAIKIGDVHRWRQMPVALSFPDPRVKRIRIEFNTSMPTVIHVNDVIRNKATFVGLVNGNDFVEFTCEGPVEVLATSEGEVWFYTRDGDDEGVELHDENSFTKMMRRRTRNPELERILWEQKQASIHRENQLLAQVQAMVAAINTGKATPDGEVIEHNDSGASGANAGATGGGNTAQASGAASEPTGTGSANASGSTGAQQLPSGGAVADGSAAPAQSQAPAAAPPSK